MKLKYYSVIGKKLTILLFTTSVKLSHYRPGEAIRVPES
jgi:hypothetical protein